MRATPYFLLVAAACDPGWSYEVPGAKEIHGDGYELAGPSDTALFAHASLFTGSLKTEVRITNNGATPLFIRPAAVHVLTRFGRPLELREAACVGSDADVVTLATGDACRLYAKFYEQPDDVELKFLTWIEPASRPDGTGIALTVKFVIAPR